MEPQVGSSSSCSSSSYDVFINFRGEDTRNNIVGHLYRALKDHGIHVFIDSKDLWKGKNIGPELLGAIKRSKISIALLSERYAESRWCLWELDQILKCHTTDDQIIFPIFFKVKSSDVKNQTGSFEISPQKHVKQNPETLETWKKALQVVGDKSGWVFQDGDDEAELVEKIVESASIQLNKVPLIDVKYPVGLESRVESVLTLLSNTTSKDVLFLGIWGLGGIGKTTIAQKVYNHIFRKFSKSCFLDDIGERASPPNHIDCLQQKLLYSVFKEKIEIDNPKHGSRLIKERLEKIDILLILDDVSHHTQLDALAGDISWFGRGSRIIITTRDEGTLRRIPENDRKIYKPEELNMKESLKLFSSHAFFMDQPPEDYMQLSNDIIHTTAGLPLALEVLGSDLSMEKDKEVWTSMHRMLKQVPHNDVYGKLKISYDNLKDGIEEAMFLDAACCFIGYEEEIVISIWEACGYEPRYHLKVLKRKSLLKVHEQKVRTGTYIRKSKVLLMHDQLRDMGRQIANEQSLTKIGKQGRLWSCDNIMKILSGGEGNEMVGALSHSLNHILNTKIFKKMPNLRLLRVDGATLEGNFQCLPSTLRFLSWCYCPLEELPTNFYHEKIVMLDLCHGCFKQAWNTWFENKVFQQLKILKLSNCVKLFESPNFSGFPRLERLYLDGCSLVNLHESIGELQQLVYLNLGFCISLKKLPDSICRLNSLQKLILSHCILLTELPESIADLKESLVELLLEYTKIKALPNGVGLLKKLEVLDLSHCFDLVDLPRSLENMTCLQYILLSGRAKLRYIPKLPSSLIELRLCELLSSLTDVQNMKRLELLCLKKLSVKEEQPFISGIVRKSYGEFNLSALACQICVHYSWPVHGQVQSGPFLLEGACLWGNTKCQRQIWIRLQEREEGHFRKHLIPDDEIDRRRRLIMLISVRVSGFDPKLAGLVDVNATLNFKACIHSSKDQRTTYCENGLRIEDMELINPDEEDVHKFEGADYQDMVDDVDNSKGVDYQDIEHVVKFKGFDWFGFQLEAGDTIEILEVGQEEDHPDADDDGIFCSVRELNLFLIKEEGSTNEMGDDAGRRRVTEGQHFSNYRLDFLRYHPTEGVHSGHFKGWSFLQDSMQLVNTEELVIADKEGDDECRPGKTSHED